MREEFEIVGNWRLEMGGKEGDNVLRFGVEDVEVLRVVVDLDGGVL